jgi:hypothetical protein
MFQPLILWSTVRSTTLPHAYAVYYIIIRKVLYKGSPLFTENNQILKSMSADSIFP